MHAQQSLRWARALSGPPLACLTVNSLPGGPRRLPPADWVRPGGSFDQLQREIEAEAEDFGRPVAAISLRWVQLSRFSLVVH